MQSSNISYAMRTEWKMRAPRVDGSKATPLLALYRPTGQKFEMLVFVEERDKTWRDPCQKIVPNMLRRRFFLLNRILSIFLAGHICIL